MTQQEDPYYGIKALSNSTAGFIDPKAGGHPKDFKDWMEGKKEFKRSPALVEGTVMHTYMLEPEKFACIPISRVPGDKVKAAIEGVFQFFQGSSLSTIEEYTASLDALAWIAAGKNEDESEQDFEKRVKKTFEAMDKSEGPTDPLVSIINIHLKEHEYQNNWKLPTKLNAALSPLKSNGLDYLMLLLDTQGQQIISEDFMTSLINIKENLSKSPTAEFLILDVMEDNRYEVFTEIEFLYTDSHSTTPLTFKGKLDRLVVDVENKEFHIVDVKSTPNVVTFQKSFEKYGYARQVACYEKGIMVKLQEMGYEGFKPGTHYIVAMEKIGRNLSRVFEVSRKYITQGYMEWNDIVERVRFHTECGDWSRQMEEIQTQSDIYLLEPEEDDKTRREERAEGDGPVSTGESKAA